MQSLSLLILFCVTSLRGLSSSASSNKPVLCFHLQALELSLLDEGARSAPPPNVRAKSFLKIGTTPATLTLIVGRICLASLSDFVCSNRCFYWATCTLTNVPVFESFVYLWAHSDSKYQNCFRNLAALNFAKLAREYSKYSSMSWSVAMHRR